MALATPSLVKTTLVATDATELENPSALLGSLHNIPALYDLSTRDLEILITRVVPRKDGYIAET
ncbi:hypothetical protein QCA50_020183 [Cerrena zonata]|uniref:Uncharacterized protein n=1 Tax=Cerrena zonata TaxID=2478898 RepID=A0AAW0FCR4_9APHY